MKSKRIIGLDMHPDVFAAAALRGEQAIEAVVEWVQDRQPTAGLEAWAKRHLRDGDVVVLEASGNSFAVAARLHAGGHQAIVLESAQASRVKENFCNDDRQREVPCQRPTARSAHPRRQQPQPGQDHVHDSAVGTGGAVAPRGCRI